MGGDVARTFPLGAEVEVIALEVDPSGRRIRPSRKAVLDARERDEVREYTERTDDAPARGFGSIAEQTEDALRRRTS